MSESDACIVYRVLSGIKKVARERLQTDVSSAVDMFTIVGQLEFRIFGFDCFAFEELMREEQTEVAA